MKRKWMINIMRFFSMALCLSLLGAQCEDDGDDNASFLALLGGASYPMVTVPATTNFDMGYSSAYLPSSTTPVHTVASISAFEMGTFEVNYNLWYSVRVWAVNNGYVFAHSGREGHDGTDGEKPTSAKNEPVTNISFRDAVAWCNAYSEKEGYTPCYYNSGQAHTAANVYKNSSTGGTIANSDVQWSANGFRLPTEVEWEYAARYIDGSSFIQGDVPSGWVDGDSDGNCYEDNAEVNAVAWTDLNADLATHPVGELNPNALGIYDMSGNVSEICWDWDGTYTTSSPYTDADPVGPDTAGTGNYKVRRGGDYNNNANKSKSSWRTLLVDSSYVEYAGIRLVRRP